ncbi:MAG: sulfotransferase family protein, partial [Nitrosospira sp.]|nr:sulfotransferase family protein [Nitrosospira sp.]
PKAAGTSINYALYGRTLGHFTAKDLRRHFPSLFARSFVFSFVRNPWSRVLSAYRFAKAGHTESMGIKNPSQYQVPVFQSFERFLFEWLAMQNLNQIDFVFQPQYRFVCDENEAVIVDYIGKVETLAEDARVVGDRLRKDLNIGHANRTGDGSAYVRQFHSQDMVDLIAERYATDIALFNYSFGT